MGELLNYNAYGSTIDDLHFHQSVILKRMKRYADPLLFMHEENVIDDLEQGHQDDFQNVEEADWIRHNITYLLDEK